MEERYGDEFNLELSENRELSEKDKRRVPKLKAIIDDSAATEGEKEQAKKALQRLTPEVIETTISCASRENWRRLSDRRRS